MEDVPAGVFTARQRRDMVDYLDDHGVGGGLTKREGDKALHQTIDFEEFRNYQVGVGYQHKNVIRQKTPGNANNCGAGMVIRDMTGGRFNIGKRYSLSFRSKKTTNSRTFDGSFLCVAFEGSKVVSIDGKARLEARNERKRAKRALEEEAKAKVTEKEAKKRRKETKLAKKEKKKKKKEEKKAKKKKKKEAKKRKKEAKKRKEEHEKESPSESSDGDSEESGSKYTSEVDSS